MPQPNIAAFDDHTGDTDSVLSPMSRGEIALEAVSHLAVVFALSLALILILGPQMGQV